jgi:hypothetical protein
MQQYKQKGQVVINPHDMDQLTAAHNRAMQAVMDATNANTDQADELVTSISALVFETLKHYMKDNNATHN